MKRPSRRIRQNQPVPEPSEPALRRREPSEEEIRRRAYEIYLARGGVPGREVEDWLQAEQELRAQYATQREGI